MAEEGFKVDIPGGLVTPDRDWTPSVKVFNSEGFISRDGEVQGMTILYNFPSFNPLTATNTIYENDSSYSSSFYGAYIVKGDITFPFGYNPDGSLNEQEIISAFDYDYRRLVLESLGSHDFEFNVIDSEQSAAELMGLKDWVQVDSLMTTNSVSHSYNGFKRAYLQYGRPFGEADTDFPSITMHGRLFIRYFDKYHSTVILYIMAPEQDTVDLCEKHIISKTKIYD